jgi:hypothetical protein
MVRTIEYFFVASLVVGIIATPGLGALALPLLLLIGLGFVWRSALTVATRGRPSETVVHTRTSHLLGPGGPDDSFAAEPPDAVEYPAVASGRSRAASAGARNGVVQGANVVRPGLVGLRAAPTPTSRSEN